MKNKERIYPMFICLSCAINNGGIYPKYLITNWQMRKCEVCKKRKQVTVPNHFDGEMRFYE
jgi:hypothetical protein